VKRRVHHSRRQRRRRAAFGIPALLRTLPALALLAALAASAGAPADVRADGASLPSVPSGARPGPDVLYAAAPAAPQLENHNPRFNAAPLLVSGQEAYIDGEYLYQDYLYDDYGSDTDGNGATPLSPRRGNINYPTNNARYGRNAADLVEFRIDVAADSVLYRITLNTLLVADSTVVAIAFNTDLNDGTGVSTLPGDPGATFPGTDELVSFAGGSARHFVFPGGLPTLTVVPSTVDLEANQLTIEVPRTLSDPTGTWRTTVATGLYNTVTGGWLRPIQTANATTPGGSGPLDQTPSGIFNHAFRFSEPVIGTDTPPDTQQSLDIRNKQTAPYAHDIDFAKLDAGDDSTTIPATGPQIRIFPSRLQLGEGQNLDAFPAYLGQLQPYFLYIPSGYTPVTPRGLVLSLHSLSEHYWQYAGSTMYGQVGDQLGYFVATSLSRGDDGWYKDVAEYDVFEMWNDVASHFTLDPDKTAISGYSMGGYATYRLGTLYPDLFAKAFSVVGPPGEGIWEPPAPPTGSPRGGTFPGPSGSIATLTNNWLENARNLPYMNLVGTADELVPYVGPQAQNLGRPDLMIDGFDQHGYRFNFLTFDTTDHLFLALLGYDYPMSLTFLNDIGVNRDPNHVTFSYAPTSDTPPPSVVPPSPPLGLKHDHAYWVSDLVLDSTSGTLLAPAEGTIDAFSHAFGLGDPASTIGVQQGTDPLPYTEYFRIWASPPSITSQNRLDITLTNLAQVTVDANRAGLSTCGALRLEIDTDSPTELLLEGYTRSVVGTDFQMTPLGLKLLLQPGHTTARNGADCDGDGVGDVDEQNCGGDHLNPLIRPERIDDIFAGVDDDADTQIDEPLPAGSAAYDCDGDHYTGTQEAHVFSGAPQRNQDACGADAWPADIVDGPGPAFALNRVQLPDLSSYILPIRKLNTSPGDTDFDVRWDLAPGATFPFPKHINLGDLQRMAIFTLPPMFGGVTRAFNGPVCPWPN